MKRTRKQRNVKDDDASYRPRKRASTSKPAASTSRPTATTESTASTAEERTDSRSQEPAEDLDRRTLMNLDGVNITLPYLDVHEYARGLNKSEVRQRGRPDQLVATIMEDWSVRKMCTWAETAERAASEAEETAAVEEIVGIVGWLKSYLFTNVRFTWNEIANLRTKATAFEDMAAETESRRTAEAEEAANKLMAEAKARQRLESNLDAAKSATTKLMAKLEEASTKEAEIQRQMILLKEMNASLRSKHAELCTKNAELVTENANIMRTNAELYRMNQELQLAQISGDVGNAIKVEED